MIFPHEFYEAEGHLFMPQLTDERLHMGNIVWLAASHPRDKIQQFNDRNTIHFVATERRSSSPKFSKAVVNELKMYYNTPITSHLYVGYDDTNRSFSRIHRDTMDVIIVQQYGTIDVSIWSADTDKDGVSESEATLTERQTLNPGDAVYIPKGTFHWVEPHGQRITYSFGIE